MENRESSTRILIFKANERRYGFFEHDIARMKRYSDKALHELGNSGEEFDIRSMREYLSIPEDIYSAKPILIRPHGGRDLLAVDSVWKKRRVKTYNIFPTRFDYIKEVLIDNERISVFELPDLLQIIPPLETEALESVKNDNSVKHEEGEGPETDDRMVSQKVREKGPVHREGGEPSESQRLDRPRSHGSGFTYALLFLSCAVLAALGIFIFQSEYLDGLRSITFTTTPVRVQQPVLSYLSHQTKLQVQNNVYELLQKEKAGLVITERALVALESEKNSFLRNIEERDATFDEYVSIFDIDESYKELRSVVDFVRNKVSFKGEVKRRSDQFLQLYETRRESLASAKAEHEQQIEQLTVLIQRMQSRSAEDQYIDNKPLFIEEAKAKQINRFMFLIERGDYNGALETLERTASLPFNEEEQAMHLLIGRLLALLNAYGERMAFLNANNPFDDIKISYLNEDYGTALRKVRAHGGEEYIRPLLGGVESGLYVNMEMERQIEENLELRKKVNGLADRAKKLEENGDYVRAIDAYETILTMPLPTYDREYILNRVHSLWLQVELVRLKREENTKAIKYLESARILNREGNERGAIEYYRTLLVECPHSDFVTDAVDEMMKIHTM
jgi:hypothetical protein